MGIALVTLRRPSDAKRAFHSFNDSRSFEKSSRFWFQLLMAFVPLGHLQRRSMAVSRPCTGVGRTEVDEDVNVCLPHCAESQRKVHIIYIIDPSESLPTSILTQLQPDLPAPALTARTKLSPQQPLLDRIPAGPAAGPSSTRMPTTLVQRPTPTGPKKTTKPTPAGPPPSKKVSAKPPATANKSLLSRIDVSLKDRIGGLAPGASKVVPGFQDTSSPAYQAA